MKNQLLKSTWLVAISLLLSGTSFAQKKIASPRDSVSGTCGSANVVINYGSPSVKGRTIWGDLVPYDKVWRAGANEATTFTTNKDIMVDGKLLPKGTYAFFTIPGEKEWIVIFNKDAKQWGAYKYKESEDALRVTVKPVKSSAMNERLNFKISKTGFSLFWENLEIPVSIK